MRTARSMMAAVLPCVLLAACGGGGGSSPPPASFAVTPSTLSFSASSPILAAPFGQFVTGTVTGTVSGTLYVVVDISGPAVLTVNDFTFPAGSNSGTAAVEPNYPYGLGTGTFTSTLKVHACVNDPTCNTGELTGSPQTVTVTYTIDSSYQNAEQGGGATPGTVASGAAGSVVLRGNWPIAAPTSLSIGNVAATSFSNPDPTTFIVNYPALTAGTYDITTNNGDVLASLQVIEVPVFHAHTLSYPATLTPTAIGALYYDNGYQALVVATRTSDPTQNTLLSFTYSNGNWQAPATSTISGLRSVTSFNTDLLVTSETELQFRYADALEAAPGTPFNIVYSPWISTAAVNLNTGYELVTTENTAQPGVGQVYTFTGQTSFPLGPTVATGGVFAQPSIGASADGSLALIVQSTGANAKVTQFDSTHELLADSSLVFNHNGSGRAPALDRRATHIILSNGTDTNVYDSNYQLQGTLPATTLAYVLNSTGTRAYTYDSGGQIKTFDVSTSANGQPYAQLGSAINVASVGGSNPSMIISLDDSTVFVAGTAKIVVQPL